MLKERLIDFIEDKPGHFRAFLTPRYMKPDGMLLPVYDFVGAILYVAGYSLQSHDDGIRLPFNAPWLDREWVEYERLLGNVASFHFEIPALARQLWAAEYGEKEAYMLPFYTSFRTFDCRDTVATYYWEDMDIPREHVLQFLKGESPYTLNEHDEPSLKPKWER